VVDAANAAVVECCAALRDAFEQRIGEMSA
jgi:hypothetical protein